VASNGKDFLVVWEDYRNGAGADIYGARVSSDGLLIDTNGFPINAAPEFQFDPAVAGHTNGYFVAWDSPFGGSRQILGARVSNEAVVLEPRGLPISQSSGGQVHPAVAGGVDGYIVVWEDQFFSDYGIRGTRITIAGEVLEPRDFGIGQGSAILPAVVGSGEDFLVVWQDQRNGDTFSDADVFGARVTSSGTVLDADGLVIGASFNTTATVLGPSIF
jgi:hypothetical protein